jgi:hypothetical protein
LQGWDSSQIQENGHFWVRTWSKSVYGIVNLLTYVLFEFGLMQHHGCQLHRATGFEQRAQFNGPLATSFKVLAVCEHQSTADQKHLMLSANSVSWKQLNLLAAARSTAQLASMPVTDLDPLSHIPADDDLAIKNRPLAGVGMKSRGAPLIRLSIFIMSGRSTLLWTQYQHLALHILPFNQCTHRELNRRDHTKADNLL